MLTFLKKIRSSLIETGGIRKYTIYAIGEIALVVIGILIALQINNWNEDRKTDNMGKIYIQEIYNDLNNEVININEILVEIQSQYDGAEYILSFFESEDKIIHDTAAFTSHHWAPASIFIIQRDKSTFDELKGSGRIGLIKSDSLAYLLEHFYKTFDLHISNFKEYPLQTRMELRKITFPMGDVKDAKYDFVEGKLTKDFIEEYLASEQVYETLLAIFRTCKYNRTFFSESLNQAIKLTIYMEENFPYIKRLD